MIRAEEARKIAGLTLQEKIDAVGVAIENAAKNGKRELRTGWDYTEDRDLWIEGGYSQTDEWNKAYIILTDLGYKVSFYYKELQFVDMYTLIEW